MIEWLAMVGNCLASMYRAKSWRRVTALLVLSPFVLVAMLVSPFVVLYLAFTWDGL